MADEDHVDDTDPLPPNHEPVAEPAPDEMTAAARLRAFEDEHFGKDAVRINGQIERGSGSPYQAMSEDEKHQYEALERLIAAEQKLDGARAALSVAESEHNAAMAAVERKPDAGSDE